MEWKQIGHLICDDCKGKRVITKMTSSFQTTTMTCTKCRGRGIIMKLYMGNPYRDNNLEVYNGN